MRLCKIALLAAVGVHLLLVVFNNLSDYGSNLAFVQHVLGMDTLFSGDTNRWRALYGTAATDGSQWLHHAAYLVIIGWEAAACGLILLGVARLWQLRGVSANAFNAAKSLGTIGLTVSLLLWFLAFISIGGEWFLMWQSKTWNGLDASFRMFACTGIVLIFLNQRDVDT